MNELHSIVNVERYSIKPSSKNATPHVDREKFNKENDVLTCLNSKCSACHFSAVKFLARIF